MAALEPRTPTLTQRDRAYEGFRQPIMNAGLKPGQFLSQRELAELEGLPVARGARK